MEDWTLSEDENILQEFSQDNVVASFALSDVLDNDHSSFIAIQTYQNKENKHKMARFANIIDPDWEEEIDLTEIKEMNDGEELEVEVGGLFQFYIDEGEGTLSICDSYYNSTVKQRFENIYDYITFYIELNSHTQTEVDINKVTSGIIQGAYCLCQVCGEMDFKNSPMCENGKTKAKNMVDDNIKQIKHTMFREKHEETFFYDLSIASLDCLENVDNYFNCCEEKFVDASHIGQTTPTM